MAQHHYPHEQSSYQLLEEIGSGVSAIVYKAICPSMNSIVAIKAIDLDRSRADFDNIRQEAKTMSLLSHPNILNAHCSFTVNRRLWVVMPFMSAGSLQSIINSSFPDGLSEPCIAFVLKETLNALLYLHGQGHLHRDIKAGNILIDSDGSVKLADFGVSASIYESKPTSHSSSSSSLMLCDVAGTPYWMAPEVIHSHTGYSFKADIWSFGITALELAYGRPPLSHLPPSKSLLMRITSHFRFSDYEKNKSKSTKKFSKNFREMVASCLDQDPSKRPPAEKLLKHPFFKNCKTADFFVKYVLQGLPTVAERFKKMGVGYPSGVHEESSEEEEEESYDGTIVKHRRISGWNFNEEDLEFNPVFPAEVEAGSIKSHHEEADDSTVKRVRFGGESIIQESGPPSTSSSAQVEAAMRVDDPNIVSMASEMGASSGEVGSHDQPAQIETPTQVEVPDTNILTDMGTSAGDVGSQCPSSQMVPVLDLIPALTELQLNLDSQKTALDILLASCGDVGEAVEVAEMSPKKQLLRRVVELMVELDQEKRKTASLERNLELLRKKDMTECSSITKTNGETTNQGHGSSSVE